jgi:hypothetical protein
VKFIPTKKTASQKVHPQPSCNKESSGCCDGECWFTTTKAGVNQQPPVHLNISNGWMMDEWVDEWMDDG